MSAPLPPDELARLEALARYQILDTMPEEAFDRITRLAARVLDVPVAIVNFVAEDRQWGKACYGLQDSEAPREDSFCAWAILSEDVTVVPNAKADERFAHNPMVLGAPHVHLYAGAPLVTPDGFSVGTLCVTDDRPHAFGAREQEILRELAALVVDEMELRLGRLELEREARANQHMMHTLRKTTAYAETLIAVNTLLELDLEPREMTRRVVELVSRVSDVDWGALMLVNGDHADVVTAWHAPAVGDAFLQAVNGGARRGQGVIWQALERGEALYADDYPTQIGARTDLIESGVRSAAWVPLGQFGSANFVFCGARLHRAKGWSAQDRSLFGAAARSVSVALERGERERELQAAALTDSLTGLGNRRAFDLHLERALREAETFSIAVLDFDGMKRLNHEEGHERGDELLRAFATVLITAAIAGDRVYRVGSDEFAVLVTHRERAITPETARAEVLERVERVLEVVRGRGFPGVSASIGVASAPAEGRAASVLLRLADERLYRQKHERLGAGDAYT